MKIMTIAAACLVVALGACASNDDESASGGSAQPETTQTRQVATTTSTPQYAPGSQEELNATIGDRIFFDTDRYDLNQEARATIGFWADWMKTHQNVRISLEGHADERGTREYNLALAARRANSVKDYLATLGVPAGRVETISYGKERPAVLGSNPEAWSRNRRGVMVVR